MKRFSSSRFLPFLDASKKALSHGGNLLSVIRNSQKDHTAKRNTTESKQWIDLSSAVNRHPWPIPAVPDFLWHELPDTNALVTAASEYYGCQNFVPVAGTQQAIESLPTFLHSTMSHSLAVGESEKPIVLVPKIGYQEHGFAWAKWGYDVQTYTAQTSTAQTDTAQTDTAHTGSKSINNKLIDELSMRSWHVLILIQPNNPSTHLFSHQDVTALIRLAEQRQGYVIIDEAFIDPVAEDSILTVTTKDTIYNDQCWPESLIVLKSVGKFFGLPGARVGFLFASPSVCHKVSLTIGPWPMSTPAVWLVTHALKDSNWQARARADLLDRKRRFATELLPLLDDLFSDSYKRKHSRKKGKETTQTWFASHLFFTVMSDESEQVFTQLQDSKIHTRLGENWLRFALPSNAEFDSIRQRLVTQCANNVTLKNSTEKQQETEK